MLEVIRYHAVRPVRAFLSPLRLPSSRHLKKAVIIVIVGVLAVGVGVTARMAVDGGLPAQVGGFIDLFEGFNGGMTDTEDGDGSATVPPVEECSTLGTQCGTTNSNGEPYKPPQPACCPGLKCYKGWCGKNDCKEVGSDPELNGCTGDAVCCSGLRCTNGFCSQCGNGTLEKGEQCDDGPSNGAEWSGCNKSCQRQARIVFCCNYGDGQQDFPSCKENKDCGWREVCVGKQCRTPCTVQNQQAQCGDGEKCYGGYCGCDDPATLKDECPGEGGNVPECDGTQVGLDDNGNIKPEGEGDPCNGGQSAGYPSLYACAWACSGGSGGVSDGSDIEQLGGGGGAPGGEGGGGNDEGSGGIPVGGGPSGGGPSGGGPSGGGPSGGGPSGTGGGGSSGASQSRSSGRSSSRASSGQSSQRSSSRSSQGAGQSSSRSSGASQSAGASNSAGNSTPTSAGGSQPTSAGGSQPTSAGGSQPTSAGGSQPTSAGGSQPRSGGSSAGQSASNRSTSGASQSRSSGQSSGRSSGQSSARSSGQSVSSGRSSALSSGMSGMSAFSAASSAFVVQQPSSSSAASFSFCGDNKVNGREQCEPGGIVTACANTPGQLACGPDCTWKMLPVCEGIASSRPFGLHQFSSAAVLGVQSCGDGIRKEGEECDDGNLRDNDGCSSLCLLEVGRCGDNIVQTLLGEQCEPSILSAIPCRADCRYLLLACGDGKIDLGEACDLGVQNADTPLSLCRSDCSLPRCGDRIIDASEECDDGNRLDLDGCSALCRLERGSPTETLPAVVLDLPFLAQTPVISCNAHIDCPAGSLCQAGMCRTISSNPPAGDTGPAAVVLLGAAGGAAGLAWVRRRRRK